MSSKELLLKKLETLDPLEILQLRSYLRQLKGNQSAKRSEGTDVDMKAIRKSLSSIKGSMAEYISKERDDRI